ncbi:MAG: alpha-galactosidase [Bacteroidetes bacterium]|nr:alpha-galactosidase [Bacteroidota bacterium]
MKPTIFLSLLLISVISISCNQKLEFTIENEFLSRSLSVENGKLQTKQLQNKISGKVLGPENNVEFQLRISQGTDTEGTDVVLTSEDFSVKKVLVDENKKLGFLLKNKEYELEVEVYYEIQPNNFYANKYLKIRSAKTFTLERIDVEAVALKDIYQPYQMKQITAWGPSKWRPGLGQPLFTKESATFWGTEFPASHNFVENSTAYCGYLLGKEIQAEETYITYKSVVGVGDDANYIQDTFLEYIDKIRIRPLRLQVQYNSWFDFGNGVTKDKFASSVEKINQELMIDRNVPPLRAFVIDDGWQNARIDWSEKAWQVNDSRFDLKFETSFENVKNAKSNLGLWLSPGCNFGGRPAVPIMREKGLEALDQYMSLAGPKYMQLLEDRMLELTTQGVTYFKLDGLFGHLNRREFDFNGADYGVPTMKQLDTEGFKPADERLNDKKYDELKTYYLVAGTERLMQIFEKQHKVNPDVYIVVSNGAYLSPWWLMYTDAIWMINAGDAAGGSNRTQELVYRDGVYYDTWVTEKTQFPINSVFNHEPKKTKTGESVQQFSEYLWMNLSRGTGFVELYIKTEKLSESDWDVMADGLKWAHKVFPYFKYARMHGGNPKKDEVYGYAGFNVKGGYASFHNPSKTDVQTYSFTLNRAFGLNEKLDKLTVSSPLSNAEEMDGETISRDEEVEITLNPEEVKILEFNQTK